MNYDKYGTDIEWYKVAREGEWQEYKWQSRANDWVSEVHSLANITKSLQETAVTLIKDDDDDDDDDDDADEEDDHAKLENEGIGEGTACPRSDHTVSFLRIRDTKGKSGWENSRGRKRLNIAPKSSKE